MAVRMNRMDREVPFLSNKVKGDVKVDIPDGCEYNYGEPEQEMGFQISERIQGARSGSGKKTSVV